MVHAKISRGVRATIISTIDEFLMQNSPGIHRLLPREFSLFIGIAFFAFTYFPAFAQSVSASSHTAKATANVAVSPPLAVADLPFGLADGLVRALRQGGFVLYLRHGAVLPGSTDQIKAGEWWKDCANTQRIGAEVQGQMRAIAEALLRQRIVVYEVFSSEFCRAFDTAGLLGATAPQRDAALNDITALGHLPATSSVTASSLAGYAAGIQQLLAKPIPPKTNRLLVGHALPPTIIHPSLATLSEGETAIFKVEPGNRFHYITTLSPGQWQSIGKQAVIDFASSIPIQAPQVISAQPLSTIALIDSTKELKGAALVQALKGGGYNLYMRHALSNVGQDGNLMQTPRWWENCTIQRNIADSGQEQARKVGAAIKTLKIPISEVLTAQFCRTRDTGHAMGLGPIEITEDLNHQTGQRLGFDVNAARFNQLAKVPARGTNRVLVSHTHASTKPEERIMSAMQEAEIVVFHPDRKGGSEPIARIPLTGWDILITTAAAAKP